MAKTVKVHPYERSPHSGAGNCWCGWPRESIMHPHEPVGSLVSDGMKCICGKSWNNVIHAGVV